MLLTYLGHAGFLIETEGAVVVTDPWLSQEGAFDSSWFQLPQNHHLAPWVREKLSDPTKERFIYVSHEHKDHFDPIFLASLPAEQISMIVPYFQRSALRDEIGSFGWKRLVVCRDDAKIEFEGGELKLYVSDSTINRDSALLVRSEENTFLDLNDCKIHDRLEDIAKEEGPISAFSAQFSGAIWHPPRYDYDQKAQDVIARKKMFSKFESVARAIKVLQPRLFLSSAGPACFLDPELIEENFRKVSIFPRAPQFFRFLEKRLGNIATRLIEPMPGDRLDIATATFQHEVSERLSDENFEPYVRAYSERMRPVLESRHRNISQMEAQKVLEALRGELRQKLDKLTLRERVDMPLYVKVKEVPDQILEVDFPGDRIGQVREIPEDRRHVLEMRSGDIAKVLDSTITWDEFLLSLRFMMSRRPDAYDPVLHGFLALQAEDIPGFCDSMLALESRQERIVVQAGEKLYSIHRYCPHQGADLSHAWVEDGRYLVCPRHRWPFDLQQGGKCKFNQCSIHAIEQQVDQPIEAAESESTTPLEIQPEA